MQTASIQARLPKDLKDSVEGILRNLGLDISTAIRIFFVKIRDLKGIPFPIHEKKLTDEEEEEKFWNAMTVESLKTFWGPEDDVWDEILPKLPSIKPL